MGAKGLHFLADKVDGHRRLTEGEEARLRANLAEARKEAKIANSRFDELEVASAEVAALLQQAEGQVADALATLDLAQMDAARFRREALDQRKAAEAAKQAHRDAAGILEGTKAALTALELCCSTQAADLLAAQSQLEHATHRQTELAGQGEEAMERALEAQERLQFAISALDEATTEATQLRSALKTAEESHQRQKEAAKKAVDRKQQELDDGKHHIAEMEAQHSSETAQHSKQLSALRNELASLERRHITMSAATEQRIGELEAQNRLNMQTLTNSKAEVEEAGERIRSLQAALEKAEATQQSWQQGEESEWQRRIADLTAHRSTEATSHEQQLLQLQGIVEALEQQKQSEASKAAQYIAALEAQHRTDEATLSGNADLTRELQARVHTQQRTLQVLEEEARLLREAAGKQRPARVNTERRIEFYQRNAPEYTSMDEDGQLMQIGQQQAAPSRSMKSTPSLQHRMSEARQQPPLPSPAPNVDLETATCTTRLSPRLPTASRAASRASESVLAPASRAAHSPRKSAQVPADEPAAALDASPTVIQPVKRTPTPASKRSASPSLRTASSPDVPTPTTPQPPVPQSFARRRQNGH